MAPDLREFIAPQDERSRPVAAREVTVMKRRIAKRDKARENLGELQEIGQPEFLEIYFRFLDLW